MMPTLIEHVEREQQPCCSREQAARLLETLRAEYQALSPELRNQVKNLISKVAGARHGIE